MNDRGRLDEKFSRFLHTPLDGIVEIIQGHYVGGLDARKNVLMLPG